MICFFLHLKYTINQLIMVQKLLAYYAFLSQNERIFGRSGERMMERIGGNLAMNVLFGLMSPNIDNWAHSKRILSQ